MIIAVLSCFKYRDAWKPFFTLLDKFWPDHPEVVLVSDAIDDYDLDSGSPWVPESNGLLKLYTGPHLAPNRWSWCRTLQQFAGVVAIDKPDETILVFQEDFFITAPVRTDMVYHGLAEMKRLGAVSVRLYPVPGADTDYGDPYFGECSQGAPYRVSCQATIWQPRYLAVLAETCATGEGTAVHFEVIGNRVAADDPVKMLAFKREALPPNEWPLQYLCSGISAGRWNPDSKRLFERHGIEADYTLRPMGV